MQKLLTLVAFAFPSSTLTEDVAFDLHNIISHVPEWKEQMLGFVAASIVRPETSEYYLLFGIISNSFVIPQPSTCDVGILF